jgi:hypothetical protein
VIRRFTGLFLLSLAAAQANVTLFLEEPYGEFGGMNPTGHAAVYFSHICAASPISLRRCKPGEQGVVISRYHRVAGYDWLAIPLLPYLYAVDDPDQVPLSVTPQDVAQLRDAWRRKNLEEKNPDGEDGAMPLGDWTQLVGSAYDRTLYAFDVPSTQEQDDKFIADYNAAPNDRRFSLLFHNCADFARNVVDFYYPGAVHRSLIADVGIMTPKQAAKSLLKYGQKHDIGVSAFVIPQVAGTVPRSSPVRGVLESLVRSKRYAVPLVSVAALHPLVGGSMILTWLQGNRFNPRKMTEHEERTENPAEIAVELRTDRNPDGE